MEEGDDGEVAFLCEYHPNDNVSKLPPRAGRRSNTVEAGKKNECDSSTHTVETSLSTSSSESGDGGGNRSSTSRRSSQSGTHRRTSSSSGGRPTMPTSPSRRQSSRDLSNRTRLLEKRRSERNLFNNSSAPKTRPMPKRAQSFRTRAIETGVLPPTTDKENNKSGGSLVTGRHPKRSSSIGSVKSNSNSNIEPIKTPKTPPSTTNEVNCGISERSAKRLSDIRNSLSAKEGQLRNLIDSGRARLLPLDLVETTSCSMSSVSEDDYDHSGRSPTNTSSGNTSCSDNSKDKEETVAACEKFRRHSAGGRLSEMKLNVNQQRVHLLDMLGHKKSSLNVAAEPVANDDLRGELQSAYDLISQQKEQLQSLETKSNEQQKRLSEYAKREMATPTIQECETNKEEEYQERLAEKENIIADLIARVAQLEINRAWGEHQLRNRITDDAQAYEKKILDCKKECSSWKARFDELWEKSQAQQKEMDALLQKYQEQEEELQSQQQKRNSCSRAEIQATFLQDAMNKKPSTGWIFGGGRRGPTNTNESCDDSILVERLKKENERLRHELRQLQSVSNTQA